MCLLGWAGLGWAGLGWRMFILILNVRREARPLGPGAAAHPPDRQVQVRREGWVLGIVVILCNYTAHSSSHQLESSALAQPRLSFCKAATLGADSGVWS